MNGNSVEAPFVTKNDYVLVGWSSKENSETAEYKAEQKIIPEGDMSLNEAYLKEVAGNFKASGEYKKVTVSKVKTLKSEDSNVKIKMIEVVHDDTADCFYLVQGKEQALLITASLGKEDLGNQSNGSDHYFCRSGRINEF